jgi:hypothetical protein
MTITYALPTNLHFKKNGSAVTACEFAPNVKGRTYRVGILSQDAQAQDLGWDVTSGTCLKLEGHRYLFCLCCLGLLPAQRGGGVGKLLLPSILPTPWMREASARPSPVCN